MAVRIIDNKWYVDIRHEGVRRRLKSPENSRQGALAYEALLRSRLIKGEPIAEKETQNRETLKDFAWEWYDSYVRANNKLSEQQSKETILRLHILPAFGKLRLDELSTRHVEQYKKDKIAAGLHPKTVNNQLLVLSRCLSCAVEWEVLEKVPKIKTLKVPKTNIAILSEEECNRVLDDYQEPMWNRMVKTALDTGMRMGELLGLAWEKVDLEGQMIHVDRALVRGQITTPKSNRSREIPMTNRLMKEFVLAQREDGLVFSQERGKPISPKMAVCALWRICKRARVRQVGWHCLRHTFASNLVMRGVPLRHVQKLLGHSSIKTTEIYVHLAPSSLYEAIAVLEGPKKKKFGQYMGSGSRSDRASSVPGREFSSCFYAKQRENNLV